jgi:hypothetical protein
MIIPNSQYISIEGKKTPLIDAWQNAAISIGLETGIYVSVNYEYDTYPYIRRIFFMINDHKFENLTELKRAIDLKVFL